MSVTINGSNTPTAGGVTYGDGTQYATTAAGTSGQVLLSNGASAPTWGTAGTSTTATNLAGGSNGTIPYQSASGTTQMLAVGTSGQVLQTNGAGAPSWVTPASNLVLISTTTASGAASASISIGAYSGTYSQYRIVCNNFYTSTANIIPAIRVATPTTPITSGYNSGGYAPNTSNQYVNRLNTSYFYLTTDVIGSVITGSLIIDITQPPSGQYGVGIFASATFDYNSDGVNMTTANYAGGIGVNGSSNLSILIVDRGGTGASTWLNGTFKLYGIKA